jgi:ATP-dependent RNA helicase SUPV3L1/SUV3
LRKFDGQVHRDLTPAELGQIAGRAGRHMNDGTFGVTGQVQPFESELIDRLENHAFDQVGMLQWRTRKLDFASIESLKDSLRETPDHPRLIRSRMVDDVIALENISHDAGVRDLASGRAGVALLWEMCQIPDYRKISAASHAELVGTLYRFVMSDAGRIPADWFPPGGAGRSQRRRSRHARQPARPDQNLDFRVPSRAMARRSGTLAGPHQGDRGCVVGRVARALDPAFR